MQSGAPVLMPIQHVSRLGHVNFSSDGSQLITRDRDGLVRRWDIGSHINDLPNDAEFVNLLRMTFTGRTLQNAVVNHIGNDDRLKARAALLSHPSWLAYQQAVRRRMIPRHSFYAAHAESHEDWFAAAVHLREILHKAPDDKPVQSRLEAAEQRSDMR